MKRYSRGLAAGACLVVTAFVLSACGGGGGGGDGDRSPQAQDAAGAPAPAASESNTAPATAGTVPESAGGSASAFVSYLAGLVGSSSDTAQPLSVPALQNVGDETGAPSALGS